jgi:hypothetical protein
MNKILYGLYFFSFAFFPVYLFPSGIPQISHILLLIASFTYLISKKNKKIKFNKALLMFLGYVLLHEIVEEMNFPTGSIIDGLIPAIYVLFNLIIFEISRDWLSNSKLSHKIFKYGMMAAVIVALMGVFILGFRLTFEKDGLRAIGTFNNPNQLGYFSICIVSISALLFFNSIINRMEFLILFLACVFMTIASLSKAAMLSIIMPICIFIWMFTPKTFYKKILYIIVVLLSITLILSLYLNRSSLYISIIERYAFFHRIANIGSQSDDTLSSRGYDLLFEADAFEFLFGYGSGRVSKLKGKEVHSTLAGVMVNYGIFGFSFFIVFMTFWARKIYKQHGLTGLFMVVLPPMIYGLAHNGIRFSIFWILLAFSFSNNRLRLKQYHPHEVSKIIPLMQNGK